MMKNALFYENGFFMPAVFLSAVIHGLLIGISGWILSAPGVSIIEAPSSLEINVIAYPVVSVIEEKIVFEKIIEDEALTEAVSSNRVPNPSPEKNLLPLVASEELQGAVTKTEPLAHINPAPPYPRIARQRGWEGIVRLEVFVGTDGVTNQVGVRESSGYSVLDKAALRTVRNWKFSPARSGSARFSSKIIIPIQFALVRE